MNPSPRTLALSKSTLTRRQILQSSTAASLAFAVPTIVPSRALGLDGHVAPSERITLGGIGIRRRGTIVLKEMLAQKDVQFLAIADARADSRAAVKELADTQNGDQACKTYRDFHELLGRKDIDAVVIATGDRWHAPMSIYAAEAGKDVYSEKPCAITIGLAQTLAETIRRCGRIFQAGTQRRSINNFIHSIELAQSGKLGKLHTLHASIYELIDRHDWLPAQPEPNPEEIDWNMWLGPVAWRPFNQAYVDGGWRGFHDFDSGAKLLDWGAHTLDLCQAANQADGETPILFEPRLDIIDDNVIDCYYANGVKLVLRRNGWMGLGTCPVRFEGEEGWVETGDSGRIVVSNDALRNDLPPPREPGTMPTNHVRNFFDCVKSRSQPAANADIARKSHIACHAAAIAWVLKRKLKFDPVNETFIDDEAANRMRTRAMREPWHV
ncbi:MAG: Gfo/Idh/MocA family oxidoreductase [Pirellulaceae bacterium]|nr:Gfo/Idh/MocA family oxidoreductase [Pirellulaceae bacterium]